MASRIIAYIVLTATQVFGRAFAQAYREAAAKASKGGNAARAANAANNARQNAATSSAAAAISKRSGMSLEEALKVLNISKDTPHEEMLAAYEHLYEANQKAKGGSFYIQSKVYRAKQTLEDILPDKFSDPSNVTASNASPSSTRPSNADKKEDVRKQ